MKQNELDFKTCNYAYPERTQAEEVRVTIGENHKRHTMTISFYHHAQTKITQGDRMVYARTGNRIYFSEPPEGKKGFKLTKRNKYEDDRKAMGFYTTYFSEADMDSVEALQAFKVSTQEKIKAQCIMRKRLRNQLRTVKDEPLRSDLLNQAAELSIQIKKLRKEVRLCESIEERAVSVREKMKTIKAEAKKLQKEKEVQRIEH